MAVEQVSDSLALAIAASIDFPELPSSGTHIVYNNRRYLLAIRNGKYVAWDISVYSPGGELVTDSMDTYLTALKEGIVESGKDIAGLAKLALVVFAGYMIYQMVTEGKRAVHAS